MLIEYKFHKKVTAYQDIAIFRKSKLWAICLSSIDFFDFPNIYSKTSSNSCLLLITFTNLYYLNGKLLFVWIQSISTKKILRVRFFRKNGIGRGAKSSKWQAIFSWDWIKELIWQKQCKDGSKFFKKKIPAINIK